MLVTVAVLVLVAVVVGVVLLLSRPEAHTLRFPESAGGMDRSDGVEKEVLGPQIADAEKATEALLRGAGATAPKGDSAAYLQDDDGRGPKAYVVLFTAESDEQDPARVITAFREAQEERGLTASEVPAGGAGGEAACAVRDGADGTAICAWATNDTYGELVPLSPGYTQDQSLGLMRALRADVESTD